MKNVIRFIVMTAIICTGVIIKAQTTDIAPDQKKAIIETALNYMDGGDEGSAERMTKALHYELTKVTPRILPKLGRTVLGKMGYTDLIEIVRANPGNQKKSDGPKTVVEILAYRDGLAMVKVVGEQFYDYLQIAEIDGEWKIVNVLWIINPEYRKDPLAESKDIDKDKLAVEKACLDYIDGSFSGSAERVERALHPELMKVIPIVHPQTGKVFLRKMGASYLIEGTRAKYGLVDEGERAIKYRLLDMNQNIAFAEVLSSMYYDYCQLVKVNGEWKIVNILWKMNPAAK